jgi:xanthine/uracil permease
MQIQFLIGLVAALIMAGGLGGVFYLANKQNAVIGNKTIQFLAVVFVLPLILILGMFNILHAESIGTLIGVIIGFVLAWFAKE